jgi:3-hydroxyacyl-CoA dehydrogenase/3-hydroxy-2-methylbutyryl-CoA dehydrogenase
LSDVVYTRLDFTYSSQILDRNLSPFSLSDFDFVMNVNVRGTIDLVRQVLPHMAKADPVGEDGERGIVIMVASAAAFDGQPGQVAYSASKGAIASLTLPMTRDLARYGIRVVTVAPSLFDSRMTSMMSDKVRASLTRVMEFPCKSSHPWKTMTWADK